MVLITIVNGVYKPTYGHLEGKLIYHWVDFPLPCLIIRSQMAQGKKHGVAAEQ
jgi:hypothetical protein